MARRELTTQNTSVIKVELVKEQNVFVPDRGRPWTAKNSANFSKETTRLHRIKYNGIFMF